MNPARGWRAGFSAGPGLRARRACLTRRVLTLGAASLFAACGPAGDAGSEAEGAAAAGASVAVEPGPAPFRPVPELLEADRAFARDSEVRGAQAWADVWTERGVLDRGGEPPAVGPEAVREAVAAAAALLRWEPIASGELWPDSLGYTVGRYWLVDDAGSPVGDTARYVDVWQRTDEGWKLALDAALPAESTTPGADAFDFWLGDWTLEQRLWSGEGDAYETFTGRTRVRAVEQGGALVESYEADARFFWLGMEEARPVRAASVRLWDPALAEWRIYWMDSVGGAFDRPFRGSFAAGGEGGAGEGVFEIVDDAAGRTRRIRFTRPSEDAVDWALDVRPIGGADADALSLWTIAFRR